MILSRDGNNITLGSASRLNLSGASQSFITQVLEEIMQNNNLHEFEGIMNIIKESRTTNTFTEEFAALTIATSLSLDMDHPVWLMVMGPPSSGKTEMLELISNLENYHRLPSLTPKHLFSGHPSASGGYMRREVGEKGILVFPDFTTVLSLKSQSRSEIFNHLRTIYDGKSGFGTGIDIRRINMWEGKVAVIAAVTEAYEHFKDKNTDLGERFLYYYYTPPEIDLANFENNNRPINMERIHKLIDDIKVIYSEKISSFQIDRKDDQRLIRVAMFISRGRAIVERDGYSREISQINTPESPYRVLNVLRSLYKSLMIVLNEDKEKVFGIISNVAKSSIPKKRCDILRMIQVNGGQLKQTDIRENTNISYVITERTIADMLLQKMLSKKKQNGRNVDIFSIHDSFQEYWKSVN